MFGSCTVWSTTMSVIVQSFCAKALIAVSKVPSQDTDPMLISMSILPAAASLKLSGWSCVTAQVPSPLSDTRMLIGVAVIDAPASAGIIAISGLASSVISYSSPSATTFTTPGVLPR